MGDEELSNQFQAWRMAGEIAQAMDRGMAQGIVLKWLRKWLGEWLQLCPYLSNVLNGFKSPHAVNSGHTSSSVCN